MFRKQSTSTYPIMFLLVDETDLKTAETGLSPTVTVSKNGGAFGSVSGTVAEVANGVYKISGAGLATDLNTLGDCIFHVTATGAATVDIPVTVVAYDPFDAVRLGLTALPAFAADAAGGLPISDAGGLNMDNLANKDDLKFTGISPV